MQGRGRQLDRLALGLGEAGKVIGGDGAQVEARGAGADLDIALLLAKLEGDRAIRQRAGDLDQEPARKHDGARPLGLGLERDVEPQLHIGGAQPRFAVGGEMDAGQRLQRRAGGDGAGGDQEGVE